MGSINTFSPFRRSPEHHENRLTWAFLVALKYEPALQKYFRDVVLSEVPGRREPIDLGLGPAVIRTQVETLGAKTTFIISVLLADTRLEGVIPVCISDRRAKYDGIIEYPDGLSIIVETKLSAGSAWVDQLSPSRSSLPDDFDPDQIHGTAIALEWGILLEGILKFSESEIATYQGRQLARDFLDFVSAQHPRLSPYRTFEICGNNSDALSNRVRQLVESLSESTGLETGWRAGGQPILLRPNSIAKEVHLDHWSDDSPDAWRLSLNIWPADTVAQVQQFRERVDPNAFFALPNRKWKITPNLHFSFANKHLVWSETEMPVDSYFDYFRTQNAPIGQQDLSDENLRTLLSEWLANGLIAPRTMQELDENFFKTNRKKINIIPGFGLEYSWSREEVISAEETGGLNTMVESRLREALVTWGEDLP